MGGSGEVALFTSHHKGRSSVGAAIPPASGADDKREPPVSAMGSCTGFHESHPTLLYSTNNGQFQPVSVFKLIHFKRDVNKF